MSVQVHCQCGYRMELPDEWRGRQGRCPRCHGVLDIPRADRAAAAAPATRRMALPSRRTARTDAETAAALAWSWLGTLCWFAAVAGGVSLVLLGAVLVVHSSRPLPDRPGTTKGATTDAERAAGAEPKPSEVFRPDIATREPDIELPPAPEKDHADRADAGLRDAAAFTPRVTASPRSASLEPWRLDELGVEIPTHVSMIEIDGVRLAVSDPAAFVRQGPVPLVLALGRHVVRFSGSEPPRVVEPRRWFLEDYRAAAERVREADRWSFDRLLELSRRSLERFRDPLVPHFWGNYYWQEGELAAAARSYAWAVRITPTFAPSYLNLAQLAHDRGDDAAARGFARLAGLWNVQNAYGLSTALASLESSLGEEVAAFEELAEPAGPRHDDLTARDRDMVAVLQSAARFEPRVTERVKILNNIGAYFEHEGKAELALEHYRSAAAGFGDAAAGPAERRVLGTIFENLARVCRRANMPEARRFERLQAALEP